MRGRQVEQIGLRVQRLSAVADLHGDGVIVPLTAPMVVIAVTAVAVTVAMVVIAVTIVVLALAVAMILEGGSVSQIVITDVEIVVAATTVGLEKVIQYEILDGNIQIAGREQSIYLDLIQVVRRHDKFLPSEEFLSVRLSASRVLQAPEFFALRECSEVARCF
jgi:hypothetical protein